MLDLLRSISRALQANMPHIHEHATHHRPLGLLLGLSILVWQSGLFTTFAATLPVPLPSSQGYVYIQSSPITDDAWIGTRVSPRLATPQVQPTSTTPAQAIDTTWLGNVTKTRKSKISGDIVLNAAPSIPIPDTTVVYPYIPVQYTTPNGTPINNISPTYTPIPTVPFVNSVFGRSGVVVGQSGDYTTSLIAEGSNMYYTQARFDSALSGKTTTDLIEGANLYFTDTRAQDALSGSIANIGNSIAILSGSLATTSSSLATAVGDIATLSGFLATTNTDLLSLSGTVANKIGLTDLSALGPLTYNNTTGVFGINIANTTTTGALSATDWNIFNNKEGALSAGTSLQYYRGDKTWQTLNTSIIPELTNLYYTQARFDSAFGLKTTTDLSEGANLYFTDTRAQNALSGTVNTLTGNIGTLSGNLTATNSNIFSLSGSLATTNSNLSTLSGTVSSKIGLTALSALGPLTYNNTTGVFGINIANTTTTGALSATDWNTFNSKESVLTFGTGVTRIGNSVGLTNTGITFAIGTTGTDMNWSTAFTALGGTATLNIPDASITARGLVSTGAQVFTGSKTFATAPTFSGFTLGSVLFASTGGLLSQNNTSFFWDNTNKRLGIGTATPTATLHVANNLLTTTNLLTLSATGLTTGNALQIIGTGSRSLLRISQDSSDPLDVERVTIGQGGIAASKPDSLARDQLYVFGRINSSWDHFLADFLGADVTRTTTDGTTSDGLIWDSVGATPTWSASNIIGISGAQRIGLSATISASAFLGNYTITESSLNPVYEARAIINSANATTRALVGFTDRAQNATTLATDTNNSTNEIFFRKKAATATWETVTRSTANATEVVTATAVPVNQLNIFRIEVLGASQNVKFYINGTLVATHTGTTVPAATIRFGHQIGMLVTAATLNTMDIDYVRMWSDDPASVPVSENIPGTASYVSDLFAKKTDTTILEAVEITTTKNTLRALDTMIDATGTGKVDLTQSVDLTDGDMSLSDAGTYFLQILHAALERLSGIWLDMQLILRSLVADEVKTEKLCIGETCITEDELKAILQSRGVQGSSSSISSGYSATATETTTGSTDSGALLTPIDETLVETLPVDTVSTESTDVTPPTDPVPVVETTPMVDTSGTLAP